MLPGIDFSRFSTHALSVFLAGTRTSWKTTRLSTLPVARRRTRSACASGWSTSQRQRLSSAASVRLPAAAAMAEREREACVDTHFPPPHTLSTRTQQPHASFALSGKDDYSAALRKAAEGAKVNVAYMEDESTPTGTVAHKSIHPARNLPHSHTHTLTHSLTHSHTHIRLAMC